VSKRKRRQAVTGIFLAAILLMVAGLAATSSAGWWASGGALGSPVGKAPQEAVATSPATSPDGENGPAAAPVVESAGHTASVIPVATPTIGSAEKQAARPRGPATMNYIVSYGDTISELAARYETTPEQLLSINKGLDATSLRAGDLIKLPDNAAERGEFRPRYVWPARGPITTPFGEQGQSWIGGYHMGLDIGASTGDIVWAADEGVIVDAGTNGMGRGYGTYILIYHYEGWHTLYAHLSEVYRSVGYSVRKGEPIGEIGMTGFADGPHLHFEVWHEGEKLDPIQFLP
jgi:LysM repeat protein